MSLASIAVLVLMVSVPVVSACLPALSPGYWKHNVKVYCGGPGSYSGDSTYLGPGHETKATMLYYATTSTYGGGPILTLHRTDAEGYTAHPLPPSATGDQFLHWANEIFQNNAYKDMWLTIANWFNAAADRYPYSD